MDKAEETAREIACRYTDGQGFYDLVDVIAAALREAKREALKEAAEIARAIDSGRGNEAEIADAIERAADAEGKNDA